MNTLKALKEYIDKSKSFDKQGINALLEKLKKSKWKKLSSDLHENACTKSKR
jgi:hypothetical protein